MRNYQSDSPQKLLNLPESPPLSDLDYYDGLKNKADTFKHFSLLSKTQKHELYSLIEKGDELKKLWLQPLSGIR